MAARAIFRAELQLGELRLPVKLYAAIEDQTVHFRLLHRLDLAPVRQEMVDAVTDEVVPPEQILRGVQIRRDEFVLIDEDERKALEPEPSRTMRVASVVAAEQVAARWIDRPYMLGPDGDAAGYFALARALEQGDLVGMVDWVMRKRDYQGALYGEGGHLRLDTLRNAHELTPLRRIQAPPSRKPDARESKLATQLIEALADDFDLDAYRDEYREDVQRLLAAKAKGKVLRMPKRAQRRAASDSLLEDLESSLGKTRGGRGGK